MDTNDIYIIYPQDLFGYYYMDRAEAEQAAKFMNNRSMNQPPETRIFYTVHKFTKSK